MADFNLPTQTWMGLLPQAQSPEQQANAMLLFQKAQQMQQDRSGGNAIAQLFSNPANLQNGMVKPDVLAQGIGTGAIPPKLGLEMIGTAAELQQRQAATQANSQKVIQAQFEDATNKLGEALLPEYDNNVKLYGEKRAREIYTERRRDLIGQMKQSGMYLPQLADRFAVDVPPETLRANVLGLDKLAAGQRADRTATLAEMREARAEAKSDKPEFVGDVVNDDGTIRQGVPLRSGGPTGWMDATGNPVKTADRSVHKMSTKSEVDAENAGVPTGPTDLRGEDYLKALPASRAAMIKGYAEGRIAFPGSFSLRSPFWQKMVADITQYDPSFDAVNYNSRSRTRTSFTSGKDAQNITAFNTAIGHLGSMLNAGEKLDNFGGVLTLANPLRNVMLSASGDPRVKEFNVAAQAVASELTRAFRGTGGSLTEIQDWKKYLDAAGSPEQIRGAIKMGVDLLASRINAVGEQYRRGMGTTADVTELLTPAAKKTLQALPGGEEILSDMSNTIRPAGQATETAQQPATSTKLPGGGAEASIPPVEERKNGLAPMRAPPPPPPVAAPNTPPIELVPRAQRQDGNVVVLKDENGVQHRFVVVGGGESLIPAGAP